MHSRDDAFFMKLAIQNAEQGLKKDQSPFGACIRKNDRVISVGHNRVWATQDSTAHAEIIAIRLACKKLKTIDLSGCVLYSTCEPCPMCFSACHWAKISKIVYGARIQDAQRCGFSELLLSNQVMKRMGKSTILIKKDFLRAENLVLFERWMSQEGRRVY